MRARHVAASLWQVAEIRGLQRVAAENAAATAAASLREKEEAAKSAEQERDGIERNWSAVLAGPSLPLDLAGAWSGALLRQEAALGQARSEVDFANTRLDQERRGSREATARDDMAREMAQAASRDWRRRCDEAQIQDTAERFAQRRWRG